MSRRRGFTLIELLVVIAIIAILAAILFPVFAQTREKARTAMCQSHLKQLMSALHMYTQDYDETLPWITFLVYTEWVPYGVIAIYQPYVKNNEILLCPSNQGYAYNTTLCSPLVAKYYSPGSSGVSRPCPKDRNRVYSPAQFPGVGRSMASIALPAQTPASFDGFRYNRWPKEYRFIGPNGWSWSPTVACAPEWLPNRHSGGANFGFLDGHVKWHRPDGPPFVMPINGLDYDGDGLVGEDGIMR